MRPKISFWAVGKIPWQIVGASIIEAVAGKHTIAARFDKAVLADGFRGTLQFVPNGFIAHLRRPGGRGRKSDATNRKHTRAQRSQLPERRAKPSHEFCRNMEPRFARTRRQLGRPADLKQAMMQALRDGPGAACLFQRSKK